MRTLGYLVVLGVTAAMTAPVHSLASDALITGAKLKAGDATQPGTARRKIVFVSYDPTVVVSPDGSAGDPLLNGGSVRILNTSGSGESQLIALAADKWRRVPSDPAKPLRGWKYKDVVSDPPTSDYKVKVAIKTTSSRGVLRVVVKDDRGTFISYTLDEPMQGSLGVQVSTGDDRQCANFGGLIVEDSSEDLGNDVYRGAFKAKEAPAPPDCASPSGAFVD